MRTSNFKQFIFKSKILFFTITAFILSALLFTSCSASESIEVLELDSTALIEKIESATKEAVASSSLPAATEIAFRGDLADSFVLGTELAVGLGYKVAIATDNASREEEKSDVYFSLEGKQLVDKNKERSKKRHKCFEFSFPITFFMADNSTITLESKEDWGLVKQWYRANPDANERPELVFPLDIVLKDGRVQTLLNIDELKDVKRACKENKDKRKCFRLVLPVSFTMADASVIAVNEKADFELIKEWYINNPTVAEKGVLNFPVDIMYKDETTATINNADEMLAAKVACQD
jgi:hypothetical protein